jgi:predicted GNAT family N-acyltransferase
MRVQIGGASAAIAVNVHYKDVTLWSLCSEETRKGYGTAIVNLAVKVARDLMLPIGLSVGAFGHREKSQMQLVKFYRKFGFKVKSAWYGDRVSMHIPPVLRLPYYPE